MGDSPIAPWLLSGPYERLDRLSVGWALELRTEAHPRIVATNRREPAAEAKIARVPVLGKSEIVALCKGAELGRVWPRDLPRLLGSLARHGKLGWDAIVDGAIGLQPHHAPGEWTLERALARMGLEMVSARAVVPPAWLGETWIGERPPVDLRGVVGS